VQGMAVAGQHRESPAISTGPGGSAWTKQAQLDVVGINSMEKTIILGSASGGGIQLGAKCWKSLVAKTGEFVPKEGNGRFTTSVLRARDGLRLRAGLLARQPVVPFQTKTGAQPEWVIGSETDR